MSEIQKNVMNEMISGTPIFYFKSFRLYRAVDGKRIQKYNIHIFKEK